MYLGCNSDYSRVSDSFLMVLKVIVYISRRVIPSLSYSDRNRIYKISFVIYHPVIDRLINSQSERNRPLGQEQYLGLDFFMSFYFLNQGKPSRSLSFIFLSLPLGKDI